ncbi:MAG: hypothetical protein OXH34_01710 [Bacteroidetes bacterium]|nr:hypothetical protein [Bacteroidota bacterium]
MRIGRPGTKVEHKRYVRMWLEPGAKRFEFLASIYGRNPQEAMRGNGYCVFEKICAPQVRYYSRLGHVVIRLFLPESRIHNYFILPKVSDE